MGEESTNSNGSVIPPREMQAHTVLQLLDLFDAAGIELFVDGGGASMRFWVNRRARTAISI